MNILYYDCFAGISGDMNLGAMVDLGVDAGVLVHELAKLHLESEYRIDIRKAEKMGITGTKVDVVLLPHEYEHELEHEIERPVIHVHPVLSARPVILAVGPHDRAPAPASDSAPAHIHQRNIRDIEAILRASSLSQEVIERSMRMFLRIAKAEAQVHGKTIEEVHFHEVGAIDSIVDIVGAAIALDILQVDRILSSPVQLGGGFVRCAHGLLPVPVPATAAILQGIPTRSGLASSEMTTPTGAAILAENVDAFIDQPQMTIRKIGYGLGTKDFEVPNILRVYLGTSDADMDKDTQVMIETNIDDMSPERLQYVQEQLFKAGALDVYLTQIIMKKGRPAVKMSVLTAKDTEEKVTHVIFSETTSIGLRKTAVEKVMLQRESILVHTKFGDVSVKKAFAATIAPKYKAEYEDCRRIAKEKQISIEQVYSEVEKEIGRFIENDNK